MRAEPVSSSPRSTPGAAPPRVPRRLGWWLVLFLPLSAATAAPPGLHPPALVGPLTGLFTEEASGSRWGEGRPLLPVRPARGLVEQATPFAAKTVEVDSGRVWYVPSAAGFPSGPAVGMTKEEYLRLGYQHQRSQIWGGQVARGFRAAAAEKQKSGRGRLEWSVPFSAPRPLRRIIGDEGPSLRISGERTIAIAGKSEWTAGEVQTLSGRPSKFPALSMEQESKFTVEGKVGELIDIRITQDTQDLASAFSSGLADQLANQIKLDYKGQDDAIFQEIQAGNTSLSLPGTRFVGFSQQNKGLFGIRAKGALGPVGFTTIASHEKSKSNRQTFRGGAKVDTTKKRDYEYLRNTYFFLDPVYRQRLSDYRVLASGSRADFDPADAVDENSLEVYVNDFNVNNDLEQIARPGVARVDVDGPVIEQNGYVERGTWQRLDPDNDYVLLSALGYVILNRAVEERHALAVTYRTRGGRRFGAPGDSLTLKLIKARDARPGFPTWDLEWKNVYQIVTGYSQGKKFDANKIDVQILKEVPGQEPQTSQSGKSFLQIFGLDERGRDPGTPADRLIDPDYVGLDEQRGTLILPDLTPFDPQSSRLRSTLEVKVPEIYTTQQQRDQIAASRYTIQVVSSSGQQRINLGQLGIDPESVEVRLNGERLEKGTDFNVSFAGEVTFMGEKAQAVADPGAGLEITYESQDLLGLGSQQKTLMGMRGQYEFWDGRGTLGTTMIYNNERSSERRVRVGSEPARSLVWDMDLKTRFSAPWLTRAADALPLLKTAAASEVTVQAEAAQSRPNLNTKGQGYIDDFEGSERPELVSILRTRWTPASRPEDPAFDEANRGRLLWYNPYDRVRRTEIWPGEKEQVDQQNSQTDVLVLDLTTGPGGQWGGVMATFTGGVRDFSQSKFLDVWARGDQGLLQLDLGAISEDVIPNRRLDTEDEPLPGRTTGDGLVAPEEDRGIDRRDDERELNYYLADRGVDTTASVEERKRRFRVEYPERSPDDPEGDNWRYDTDDNRDDYSRINGTQGNKLDSESAERPDTEDLNNDGVLNIRNDYFRYTIDLAHDPAVAGTESNGWRLFRLPLYGDEVEQVGKPDSSRIEYARLTVVRAAGDPEAGLKVEVAQVEVIGNEWQEDRIAVLEQGLPPHDEEKLNVTVIGTDQNLSYKPPPGVKIRRNVQSRTREREQSLVLEYHRLEPRHQMSARRVLTKYLNYTKYTRLSMYAHGDETRPEYAGADSSDLELFLRFGADSTNYYEFATRLYPGWDPRNEVDIDLLKMAQLKGVLQSAAPDSLGRRPSSLDTLIAHPDFRDGEPARYRVRGSPSMQQVKRLTIGLRHLGEGRALSGEVYVDELRLDEARNDAGIAAYARLNAQVADFASLEGQADWQGEDFRTLNSTGRNSTDLGTGLQATANLDRFLPGTWGVTLPVKASFSQSTSLPRFGPNSDVELTAVQKEEQRSRSTKAFYEISVNKRPGKGWLSNWTVDQVSVRLSQSSERAISPVQPLNRRDIQTMNFGYQMPMPKPSVAILGWLPAFAPKSLAGARLRYLPSAVNYGVNFNRQEQASRQRADADTTFQEDFALNESYAVKVSPFTAVSGDYTLRIDRDLRKKYELAKLSFGREVGRSQNASASWGLRLTRWLDQNYEFQATYEEVNDPRRRRTQAVKLDSTTGLPVQTRDVTSKNSLSARYNLRLPALFEGLGRPAAKSRREESPPADSKPPSADQQPPAIQGKARPQVAADRPFFLWRVLGSAGSATEPLNATWRRDTEGRNYNLKRRPPLLYQLGLDDSLRVEQAAVGLTQQDQWNRSTKLNMDTGLRLPLGLSVKANFEDGLTRRSGSTQTRQRVRRQQAFPRLSFNWGKADQLPYLKKLVSGAPVTASYEVSLTEEGEGGLGARSLLSRGRTRELRVSWNPRWRVGPNTKFETVRSRGWDQDFELSAGADSASGGTRPLRGSGSQDKTAYIMDINYRLKPRALPMLGKLKSEVELKFELGLESEKRTSATGNSARAPVSDTGKWKAVFRTQYRFSESFRGEGLIRIENNRNRLTDKTRMIREVRLSGTLTFR